MTKASTARFHNHLDALGFDNASTVKDAASKAVRKHLIIEERELSYRFSAHFHPYVGELVRLLTEGSVRGLQAADTKYRRRQDGSTDMFSPGRPKPELYEEIFSANRYAPTDAVKQYPVKELDFAPGGAYSVYNWELFFHVPLTVAVHLSKNGRFEEAQRWFHFLFNPTDSSDASTPERFWKVRPFQYTPVRLIEEILVNLSTGGNEELRIQTIVSIAAWKDAPFRPHAVARQRPSAYMFKTVMAYLDNLIAWGDTLFRQDSRESINEATQLYVLAANILGPRPQEVPPKGSVRAQTYAELRMDLDKFGNALRDVEVDIPFDLLPHPGEASRGDGLASVRGIGQTLYFCVPRNDKLLGYWDTVAERLSNIRNSRNLQGVYRELALYEPPIDPALLAKAVAAGVDVAAVLSGANQPLPLVRFRALMSRALRLCSEVKALGNQLLSAMEKEDNEALAALRQEHEAEMLGLSETIKYQQWQEAIKAREGLDRSLAAAVRRYTYYEQLLGTDPAKIRVPALDAIDADALTEMRFRSVEPDLLGLLRQITPDIATDVNQDLSGGKKVSSHEKKELEKLNEAQTAQDVAARAEAVGALLNLIPMFAVDVKPIGVGAGVEIGGTNVAHVFQAFAAVARARGSWLSYKAGQSARVGAFARRDEDWALQSNAVIAEVESVHKQLRAAQIRESIAEREWRNHQQQKRQAEDIKRFLTDEASGKKTDQGFYAWMKREARGLYTQCFQLAYDVAKKAERALQHELGGASLSFVRFDSLGGKEGLLAGEKLYLDLERMDLAYEEMGRREYELTKHVSLLQLNPRALLRLRQTGRCTFVVPEDAFDLDCPGHFFRRLQSVAVSVPSVTGPYTSVNCRLALLKSSIRTVGLLRDGEYARQGLEDDRFNDHFGSSQPIVTSAAQNDSGLFDAGVPGERTLPFEFAGAVSEWQLELLAGLPQFDYNTIADVIVHLRYTAREGGELLRQGAVANLKQKIAQAEAAGCLRLFSIRHEFPSEWARFKAVSIKGQTKTAPLTIELAQMHFPFWSRDRLDQTKQVLLFATADDDVDIVEKADGTGKKETLDYDPDLNLRAGELKQFLPQKPTGELTLLFGDNSMEDLWLGIRWGGVEQ